MRVLDLTSGVYSKVDDSIKIRAFVSITIGVMYDHRSTVLYRNLSLTMLIPHVKPGHFIRNTWKWKQMYLL